MMCAKTPSRIAVLLFQYNGRASPKLLMVRRHREGERLLDWDYPVGWQQTDESVQEAAARVLRATTGSRSAESDDFVHVTTTEHTRRGSRVSTQYMATSVPRCEDVLRSSARDISHAAWITRDQVHDPSFKVYAAATKNVALFSFSWHARKLGIQDGRR